ncbi:50S ribosomal protein L31e [Candidatus Woesearchaeota archaeon]|nr:50S ribosomal protein L31e [Candidatus Woesearchaeota archaeon]
MTLERTYVVPLRKEWLKAPRYKRAKRAIGALRSFLVRHMKSEDLCIGTSINLEIWKHGIKNPPGKIKINVLKDDKGVVMAELFGAPKPELKKEEEKKSVVQKVAERVTGKSAPKPEAKKEAPKVDKPQATDQQPTDKSQPAAEKKPVKSEAKPVNKVEVQK